MRAFRMALTITLFAALGAACSSPRGEPDLQKVGSRGLSQNGLSQNGLSQNGLSQNGLSQNGLSQNGLSQNGLSQNGLSQNGLSQNGLSTFDILAGDQDARDLFKYIYSCAMPADQSITLSFGGAVGNVTFDGGLGLAPEWGGDHGTCDLTCQRWISACVLARTNAFGAHVALSVRGNNPALVLSTDGSEASTYTLEEGTYFGNIFATRFDENQQIYVNDPQLYACSGPGSNVGYETLRFCSSESDDCAIHSAQSCEDACQSRYDSPEIGGANADCESPDHNGNYAEAVTIYLKAPVPGETYSVCGNNVCEVAQGESALLSDPGYCPSDCKMDSWAQQFTMFGGTTGHSDTDSNDTFNPASEIGLDQRGLAVCPDDNGVAITGWTNAEAIVDLGDHPDSVQSPGFLARYYEDGSFRWVHHFSMQARAITADDVGNTTIAGQDYGTSTLDDVPFISSTSFDSDVVLATFDSNGALLRSAVISSTNGSIESTRALASGPVGDVFVAGSTTSPYSPFTGEYTSGGSFVAHFLPDGASYAFEWAYYLPCSECRNRVVGLSVDGNGDVLIVWGGDIYNYQTGNYDLGDRVVTKLNGADGSILWSLTAAAMNSLDVQDSVRPEVAVANRTTGSVYLAGTFQSEMLLPGAANPSPTGVPPADVYLSGDFSNIFLASYSPEGLLQGGRAIEGVASATEMRAIKDPESGDDVLLLAGRSYDVDFGAGRFHSNTPDLFLAAYTTDFEFLWAKRYASYGAGMAPGFSDGGPGNCDGPCPGFAASFNLFGAPSGNEPGSPESAFLTGLDFDGLGHVVTGGLFDGFMFVDNQLVVNWMPDQQFQGDVFLNSFQIPCSSPNCDTIAPTISNVPADVTVEPTTYEGTIVWYTTPTATDDRADGVTISCDPAPGSLFEQGTTTVTCIAIDAHGNSTDDAGTNGVFTVTVADATPPILSLPDRIQVELKGTDTSAFVDFYYEDYSHYYIRYLPSAYDQFDDYLVDPYNGPLDCNPASGSEFFLGATTVTCAAEDDSGNISTGTFLVLVTPPLDFNNYDGFAPVFDDGTIPDSITVAQNEPDGASVSFTPPTATDVDAFGDTNVIDVHCTHESGDLFPVGTTKVICTAIDGYGNLTTDFFFVTVTPAPTDMAPPVLSLPSTITVEQAGPGGSSVSFSVSALDDVDGSVDVSCSKSSGDLFAGGTTTVDCSATDAAHNTASGSFIVSVRDTTAPVVSVPADMIVEATGVNGADVTFATSATDAVGAGPVVCSQESGTTFAFGLTTVTCTSVDAAGNTGAASFNVTVHDTTPPVVHVPSNITAEAASYYGSFLNFSASSTDAVTSVLTTTCTRNSGLFARGTTTVTCSSTDVAGNTGTASFTVVVRDTIAPVVHVPANLVKEATSAGGATATFTTTASDAVTTVIATCSRSSGSLFALGTTVITCTATDAAGNTGSASFSVLVRDTTAPVITVPSNQSLVANTPTGRYVTFSSAPSATDAVKGTFAPTCSRASGSFFTIGSTAVTCTAADNAGNSSAKTFYITVTH